MLITEILKRLPNSPFSRLKYRHCSEIVNQRLRKYCLPNYSKKKTNVERQGKMCGILYYDNPHCSRTHVFESNEAIKLNL